MLCAESYRVDIGTLIIRISIIVLCYYVFHIGSGQQRHKSVCAVRRIVIASDTPFHQVFAV